MRALLVAFALCATAAVAHAYPQFQLSREQTCVSCHLSPTGGGLINENGELTAEDDAKWGGDPRFVNGALELPTWMHLGADVRLAGGVSDNGGGAHGAAFPMQLEAHAQADRGPVSVVADLGVTIPREGEPLSVLMSRQHYVEWKQHETGDGWYGRAGRFMPVYGLRLAEHPAYTRRFGGTPLFSETYGATLGWVTPAAEVHVSGFTRDRLRDTVSDSDGVAVYAEKRVASGRASLGVEARHARSDEDIRNEGGVTGKLWLDGPQVLIQAEAQVVRQNFEVGPTRHQVIAYVMTSWFPAKSYMVDLGLGHYDQDIKVPDVDRNAAEVNLHWFPTAHLELILMGRVQLIGLGDGGPRSNYGLLQVHYRL